MMSIAAVLLLSSGVLYADETVQPVASKADGAYIGLGGGLSYDIGFLSVGTYQDSSTVYTSGSLRDSSAGFIAYGGYQFNKIIAVEAAYTYYGSFSDTLDRKGGGVDTISSDPSTVSVYANAGYTFGNGLRPFLQLGLGYMMINGSTTADNIGLDDGVAMRFGLGLEYAPPKLAGFGFRVSYVEDVAMDFNYKSYDNGTDRSTLMMNINGMLYVGAQYKF